LTVTDSKSEIIIMMRISVCVSLLLLAAVLEARDIMRTKTVAGRVFQERIVGGEIVTHGDAPFMVSLLWFGDHFCGGSILNENTILTAAHCLYGYEDDPYEIVAGEWSLTGNDGTEQRRTAKALLLHTGYNDRTFVNDIALMWVDQPFQFNQFVRNVTLPEAMHGASGAAPVYGWGVEAEGAPNLSDKLKMTTLQYIDDEACRQELGGNPSQVHESMICAYVPEGGTDSCQGDSGGPILGVDTVTPYQAGIVSWGYGCARPGMPGMYTEVSYFVDWIAANIDGNKN
jgi:trypsin